VIGETCFTSYHNCRDSPICKKVKPTIADGGGKLAAVGEPAFELARLPDAGG